MATLKIIMDSNIGKDLLAGVWCMLGRDRGVAGTDPTSNCSLPCRHGALSNEGEGWWCSMCSPMRLQLPLGWGNPWEGLSSCPELLPLLISLGVQDLPGPHRLQIFLLGSICHHCQVKCILEPTFIFTCSQCAL